MGRDQVIVKKSNVSYFTSMRSVNSFAFFFINGMTSFFTFGNGLVFNSIIFAGFDHGHSTLGAQSFTSLKADLHQDINRGFAFSRSLNETFPYEEVLC